MVTLFIWATIVVLSFLMLIFYLVPAILAFRLHHRHRWAIMALNLSTGWTGVGWFAAFIWADNVSPNKVSADVSFRSLTELI